MFNQIANDKLKQFDTDLSCALSESFVEFAQEQGSSASPLLCQVDKVTQAIDKLTGERVVISSNPPSYKPDHIFSSALAQEYQPTVILYGEVGTRSFLEYHTILQKAAKEGRIKYLVRHYNQKKAKNNVSLSGYGVELAIKSTEYKAIDDTRVKGEESDLTATLKETEKETHDEIDGFRLKALKELYPDKAKKLEEFGQHLLDSSKEIATLKVWELQELSLQTASRVLSLPKQDQLRTLRDIVQNFPVHAKGLIHVPVSSDMRKEIEKNQHYFMQNLNLGTGDTALFINGMYFDLDTTDVFTVLAYLRNELRLIEGLHKVLGSNSEQVEKLLKLDVSTDKQDYQIDIRDSAIVYVNDMETDKMYKSWPGSLQDLLRPTYPGMLRNVRKNMYNLVLIVDPSKRETHDIIKLAESFYVHKAPLRVGFVFVVTNSTATGFDDASAASLIAFNYIGQDKTPYDGLSFLTDVLAATEGERDLLPDDIIGQFKNKYPKEDIAQVFGADSDYDTGKKLSLEYLSKTGLGTGTKALLNGVILKEVRCVTKKYSFFKSFSVDSFPEPS